MAHLALNPKLISHCRKLAEDISVPVEKMIQSHTTVAIERAVLRLIGVEGAIEQKGGQSFPEVNLIVEDLRKEKALDRGVLYWFVNGMIQKKMPASELASAVAARKVNLMKLPLASDEQIRSKALEICKKARDLLVERREIRDGIREKTKDPFDAQGKNGPLLYVIVATGNIYDDVIQARAAAQAGADAIAVIRSTAQSLLDYVPHGATSL